jgi:hypothetical protein
MRTFSSSVRFALISLLLFSCGRNPLNVDISGIREEVTIIRYEKLLKSLGNEPSHSRLLQLRDSFPLFTDLFTDQIIRIGFAVDEGAEKGIGAFLNDTMIVSAYRMVENRFNDFGKIENELTDGFRRYRYHFPGRPLPRIYTCISGFNESVFVAEGIIGISLDKYLGADLPHYSLLGFPKYKQRKMVPEMIPTDAMYVWAMGEFEIDSRATTLLDHIIHEGKLLYFTEAMLPATHDTLITGFTAKQVEWCRSNERQMWTFLIEKELLYSTKQMDIVRYINDGPRTNSFPPESPGRTGAWLGWQIIRQYMKRNPEVTLSGLMINNNYQDILNASAYLP